MPNTVLDRLPVRGFLPLFAAVLLSPLAALAQEAPADSPDAWVKMCNTDQTAKKELCMTLQEVRADTGQPIVSASIRQVTGDKGMSLFVAVPTGMQLQPGLRFAIDEATPLEIPYGVCFPNACYAELEAKPELIDALKNGTQIVVTTFNQAGKSMTFPMKSRRVHPGLRQQGPRCRRGAEAARGTQQVASGESQEGPGNADRAAEKGNW